MPDLNLLKPLGLLNEKGEQVFVTDEMVERLVNENVTSAARKTAEEKQRKLSKEEFHRLRARCKRDLFFLSFAVLGGNRLTVDFHGHLCNHIRKTENTHRFRGYLLFRGGFKTTIITIAHSIQTVLPYTEEDRLHDPDQSPISWPAVLGPDCRLMIAHETHESSARFLYSITNHFTNNPLLMALFPEVVPSPRKHRVNKWELELPRTITGSPEPTIDTLGVGGKSQGRHYNYIKLDDIYGDKARDSEAESETTRQWFDNIQSFFSNFAKDKLDITGTRYSYDDVYFHAMEMYGSELNWYIRKIEEVDEKTGQKFITFPEGFPPKSLEIIKKNKKVYQAQYQNDPDENTNGFDQSWEKNYNWLDVNRIAIFTGLSREIINVRDLDTVFLIDPGQSKSGGFAITGTDYRSRTFVLSSLRLELRAEQLTDLIFKQVRRWKPRTVAIESDFFMEVFEPYWKAEMRNRNLFFHITPVHTKQRSKDKRIEGLTNYYSDGRIYHNQAQEELHNEFRLWGKTKNIHILDALAYGPEVWRPGWVPGTRDVANGPIENTDDGRDPETGYSAIN